MSAPAVQLLIGFLNAPAVGSQYFVLDSSTLDGTKVLLGPVFVDVTPWLTGQITLTRGRSRETDQHQAGQLQFQLRNEDRRFDPTNTASPYYPGILPRSPVQLFVAGQQVFGGYVDDYDLGYLKPATATVAVAALDAFTLLATTKINAFSAVQEYSGQRILHVLQRPEVGFPAPYSLATGMALLQASTQTDIPALSHCQTAAASEGGWLFCDRTGVLQFKDRTFVASAYAAQPNGVMTFTDTGVSYNGPCIAYQDIGVLSASTLLFNRIEGTRSGGVKQITDHSASQALFWIRTLTLPALENNADADVAYLESLYLQQFAEPEVRFDTVGLELAGLTPAQQSAVCALDIGSMVIAERTPPGGGARITQPSMVEKVSWSLDASTGSSKLTLGLMNVSQQIFLVLDSATLGILDTSKVGF